MRDKSIKFKDELGQIIIVYYGRNPMGPGISFTVFGSKVCSGSYHEGKIKWESKENIPSEKDIHACIRCFNLLVFT